MSRNYELLRQAQRNIPGAAPDSPTPLLTVVSPRPTRNTNLPPAAGIDVDRITREESLKLVQSLFLLNGAPHRMVLFAGVDSRSGCSLLCVGAADTLAHNTSGSVCLVDANFRAPSLPEAFGTTNHYGLADSLRNEGPVRHFAKPLLPRNLWLLSCGSAANESAALLNSERMKSRITELRNEFDYVLLDAPPLSTYADAVALGQLADGVVLVLEANSTKREAAVRVVENLRAANVNILGAVFNKRTFPIPESLYQLL
jgi:capsular exopolysaccharide synthesis family protein